MSSIFDNIPKAISAAAQSLLGLLALMIVALALLAFFFFKDAAQNTKTGIFVLLFIGVLGFGVAVVRQTPDKTHMAGEPTVESRPDSVLPNKGKVREPDKQTDEVVHASLPRAPIIFAVSPPADSLPPPSATWSNISERNLRSLQPACFGTVQAGSKRTLRMRGLWGAWALDEMRSRQRQWSKASGGNVIIHTLEDTLYRAPYRSALLITAGPEDVQVCWNPSDPNRNDNSQNPDNPLRYTLY